MDTKKIRKDIEGARKNTVAMFNYHCLLNVDEIRSMHFAERQVLAKSRRQRMRSVTTGLHPKADIKLPMSVFALITSALPPLTDIIPVR